jgi:integrase/recombinase XerC
MAAFLRARNEHTLRAYRQDLAVLATFLKVSSPEAAAEKLLQLRGGRANELALNFQAYLVEKKLSPATVNRRMSTLRALAKLGRMLGMISWSIEVENLGTEAYRDTLGPGTVAVLKMLDKLPATAKGVRDTVIVRLLHDLALRRGEVVSLDREHWSPERGALHVLGKKRLEREWITVPDVTRRALEAWLEIRGDDPGPMFQALDGKHFGHRLTGSAVFAIIRKLGISVGVVTRPHGLRHAAITGSLDKNGGNVRASARFSRHKNLDTLVKYDDNRLDLGGQMATLVALPEREGPAPAAAPRAKRRPTTWQAFAAFVERKAPGWDPTAADARAVGAFLRELRGQGVKRGLLEQVARAVSSKLPWWTGELPAELAKDID